MHWVDVDSPLDRWDPKLGDKGIRFHYLLWLAEAEKYVRSLHAADPCDLVHHVGWGTVSVPSPFWKLGLPLVWGPLGGGQTTPPGLLGLYGRANVVERLRLLRLKMLRLSPSFQRAVQRSAIVIAANRESAQLLSVALGSNVITLPDSALRKDSYPQLCERSNLTGTLNLLWAGTLLYWKGLALGLLAMKKIGPNAGVHLSVAGDGPCRAEFESMARRLGIENQVKFLGKVPWKEMSTEFSRADAFLFSSLHDSFGSVALEASSHGLPIITLDIGGCGTFMPTSAAVKIKPTTIDGTASAIAGAVLRLRDDSTLRREMGAAARSFAESLQWENHAAMMWQIYQNALANQEAFGRGSQ